MTKTKKLYKEIWEERPHKCAVCGYPIFRPVANVFAHVYSKGAHPALKFFKPNIQLWCTTIIRESGRGCHELSHTNPYAFKKRAKENGYQKPELQELYALMESINLN